MLWSITGDRWNAMAENRARLQTFSSTCPPPPTCSLKQRSKSTWLLYQRVKTYVLLLLIILPPFSTHRHMSKKKLILPRNGKGNYQMARQARLHPPPHRRRNQRRRRHGLAKAPGSTTRFGPRPETRMAHHARYALLLSPPTPYPYHSQQKPSKRLTARQECARTWAASRLASPATLAAGSAPATARTTTFRGERGRARRR